MATSAGVMNLLFIVNFETPHPKYISNSVCFLISQEARGPKQWLQQVNLINSYT